jgi:deoxyadenosine/deoxycytidine kinase
MACFELHSVPIPGILCISQDLKITHTSRKMYIAIEGVIGVGKTTLARLLQPGFDAQLNLEAFEENPFLSDFYDDRERYAFQTQIFFLLSRYHQHLKKTPYSRNSI